MSNLLPNLTINQWDPDDRSRKKEKGPKALYVPELLVIIRGSCNQEESSVELMKRILNHQKM